MSNGFLIVYRGINGRGFKIHTVCTNPQAVMAYIKAWAETGEAGQPIVYEVALDLPMSPPSPVRSWEKTYCDDNTFEAFVAEFQTKI